jgi:hypothetical protein
MQCAEIAEATKEHYEQDSCASLSVTQDKKLHMQNSQKKVGVAL